MIHFDSYNWAMVLPNGRSFHITTPDGANAFLRNVFSVESFSNFDFFSSRSSELKIIPPEFRGRSFELATMLLATNANKELFREKIPVAESACWLEYTSETIQLATKPSWIPQGKLQEHDKLVLSQCFAMFSHELPVALAMESDNFFDVLKKFVEARMEASLHSQYFCESFLSIVWQAFNTYMSTHDNSPTFEKLEERGILEAFLHCLIFHCLTVPKLDAVLSERIDTILMQLQLCPSFLEKHFKRGDAYGDVLRVLPMMLEDQSGITNTRDNIFQTMKSIVLSMDSVALRGCRFCCSEAYLSAMKVCSQCRTACYCSWECQKADWDLHKRECSLTSTPHTETATDMRSRLSNFMKDAGLGLWFSIIEACDETGLGMQDIIVQLDFVPNEDGIVPALQKPPIYTVTSLRKESNWGIDMNYVLDYVKEKKKHKGPNDVTFLYRAAKDDVRCLSLTE